MKFDIVRAWKDESYRQSLSNEQRTMLPANPVGELSEAEMEMICGGGGGGGVPMVRPAASVTAHHYHNYHHGGSSVGITGSATSAATSFFEDVHPHSISVALCETNVFSAAQTVAPVAALLSPITVICANVG